MPRLPINHSNRIEQNPPLFSQCRLHPLYNLRRYLITIALIGCVLLFINFDHLPFIGITPFFLFWSEIFAMYDLLVYAQQPDENPKWPLRKFLLGDLAFAILLQYCFWGSVADLEYPPYYRPSSPSIIVAWGALTVLICSVLHAVSFYKQLVAFYKAKWQAGLVEEACARCGYGEQYQDEPAERRQPPNLVPYVGPSAEAPQASVLTPASQESAMEEGLLIGSDYGSSHGSVEAETVIEAPEVVVFKGKKKKIASN